MIFEFFFTLVVLLITCTVVCPLQLIAYTHPPSIYATRAPLRTTLLPSYPRNLTRTHSQVHPAAVSSKVDVHSNFASSSLLFSLSFTHYFVGILTLCPNPPSFVQEALLPAGFYQQYYISAYCAFCLAIR
jgi:hypothetical protein